MLIRKTNRKRLQHLQRSKMCHFSINLAKVLPTEHNFELLGRTACLSYRGEHQLHELNSSGATCTSFGTKDPHFSLERRALGSAPGPSLPRHPTSVKRVNRVEERKLLPESETLWGGPQALRAHHNQDNSRLYPWAPGRNSHSLSRCAGTSQGGREGGYQSIEAPQINEPSINTEPPSSSTHRSFLCFLSANSVSSLSLSTTHQALRASEEPPAPLVWSERSHDQQASTRSRTDWLTPQAQPRQKDPEGVNSTISELFHMTQQSVRLANKGVENWLKFENRNKLSVLLVTAL